MLPLGSRHRTKSFSAVLSVHEVCRTSETSFGNLNVVHVSEKIAAVPYAGRIVRARKRNAGKTGRGDAAVDHEPAGARALRKIQAGRELRQQRRIQIESSPRVARTGPY